MPADPATFLALLSGARVARELLEWIMQQVALARAAGDISQEQFDLIKAQGQAADSDWDAAVAAAKARLAAAGGGQ